MHMTQYMKHKSKKVSNHLIKAFYIIFGSAANCFIDVSVSKSAWSLGMLNIEMSHEIHLLKEGTK